MAILSREVQLLAAHLQAGLELREAAPMHQNVRAMLSQAISDAHKDSGYGYYMDHSGDGETGDVVYQSSGKLKKTGYSIAKVDGKMSASVATDKAKNVTAVTTYKESEALRERRGDLKLTESIDWNDETLALIEADAGAQRMEIKLIAPGKGASAFYPAEVLKRDGPKVFTSGTQMYINHATKAEEAARPEGDWHKLAGALDGDAYYMESHAKGPGLYGMALFSSEFAPAIREKAKFSGLSIRAGGLAESGKKQDGLPILKEFTYAESIDVVTRAGAGGMVLTESARITNTERGNVEMTDAEVKALVESSTKAAVEAALATVQKPVTLLEAKALKGEATGLAHRLMTGLSLAEASKQRVVESVTAGTLPTKDGELDVATFTTLVTEAAKREGEYVATLTKAGAVRGMGAAPAVQLTEAEVTANANRAKVMLEESEQSFMGLGLPEKIAKLAATGRGY